MTERQNNGAAKAISVLVVDDHPLFRESVARVIDSRNEMNVIGVAEDGDKALEILRAIEPDVCVLDVHLPGMDGEHVIDAIMREHLRTRTLILSGDGSSEDVFTMIEAGAGGFLLKTSSADQICAAIVEVAAGETVIPTEFHGGIAAEIRSRHADERPALTERELGILRLIAHGDTAADIGEQLNLAPSTVKTHLTRIYDKLGVSERAAAVAQAIRHGLIE